MYHKLATNSSGAPRVKHTPSHRESTEPLNLTVSLGRYCICPRLQAVFRPFPPWDPSQQTQDVESMLVYCWSNVVDGGPTLNQYWFNVLCLLGYRVVFQNNPVKRSDVTGNTLAWLLGENDVIKDRPHTSLYQLARWKYWRSRLLSFTE